MRLRPMTRVDLPACVTVACDSFIDDQFFAMLVPLRHKCPSGWRRFQLERLRKRFSQPGYWCVVCVEDSKETRKEDILGFAMWQRFSLDPSSPYNESLYSRNNINLFARIERLLYGLEDDFNFHMRTNSAIDHRICGIFRSGGPPHVFDTLPQRWQLSNLNVAPRHQRRGVGILLIEWGLDRCREEGAARNLPPLSAALMSSPVGQNLYAKKGFKIVAWFGEDLGLAPGAAMIWDEAEEWTRPVEASSSKYGLPVEVMLPGSEAQTGVTGHVGQANLPNSADAVI